MDDSLKKRGILTTSMLYILLPILMGLKELPLILPHEMRPYIIGRLLIIVVSSIYFILTLLNRTPSHFPVALYLIGLTYSIHGQYFQPNYWLAMIELNALYPLFFLLRKELMLLLYGGGLLAFDVSFYKFSNRFIQAGSFSTELRNDIIIGTVITAAIALFTYNNLIMARVTKNRLLQRFVDVGKNFSFIIHDLKGMVATPTVYASLLQRAIESTRTMDREQTLIRQLAEDLNSIKTFVTETTRLVSADFADEDRRAFIKLSEATRLVQVLLRSKLKTIKIEQHGDISVGVKLELLNRILINIINNSADALTKGKQEEGKITIRCRQHSVEITDNSGTQLSAENLRKLNSSGDSFTNKAQGSGLGTLIIRDYVASVGGTVRYSNGAEGVTVSLEFPKKLVEAPHSASVEPAREAHLG